ncbi:GDSL esterase/lipase 6 [Selaginella moellendorffii]|uniref:GDSL esterase/lipase 6 n=1 Tax=Selaginella moellendorffii TaxID=88036 RepID=UPI000D1C3C7A|nr:GDSL esterase/lipase 6 [Selaginella moellendorffii]|eukprot:XP_024540746.1 GDSL esterase/lipase 6 [Selaginella moellendorffii]
MKTSSKILVFLFAILALCACVYGRSVPQLRTIYMGDSIFDVGTNKYVKNSVSRCDFVPYGKTRYNQPSGRCSDGFLIPDLINKVIDWGVVSFNEQLKQLGQLANKIPMMNLNDFVVVISSGGNDIAANLQNLANVDLEAMLVSLEKGLEQLYKYGFRKIVYSSLGPLGCVPIVTSDGNCVREINDLVEQFNWQARAIVLGVAKKFPGMRGAFVDGYSLIKSACNQAEESCRMEAPYPSFACSSLRAGICEASAVSFYFDMEQHAPPAMTSSRPCSTTVSPTSEAIFFFRRCHVDEGDGFDRHSNSSQTTAAF